MTATPRETAVERMQRVLAEVLWIAERDGPLIADAAAHFGVAEEELHRDLDMASMIGSDRDEFTEMPVEMFVEDGRVHVHLHAFDRPLRLTPAEALSLVAAGSALTGLDSGSEALSGALDKVAGALGVAVGDQVDVDLGVDDPEVFAAVRVGTDEHRAIAIVHVNVEDDTRTERVVEPWALFQERGAWYLRGHCRRARAERQFRVDRILSAEVLDEPTEVPAGLDPSTALRAGADAPRLVLDLEPSARWVLESYPAEAVEERPDGSTRATLVVVSRGWAERLLLRVGGAARIVDLDPSLGREDPGTVAARRILARYEPDGAQH